MEWPTGVLGNKHSAFWCITCNENLMNKKTLQDPSNQTGLPSTLATSLRLKRTNGAYAILCDACAVDEKHRQPR